MHQGGGLEGLPGLFTRQLLSRQLAQLIINEGQELLGGVWVALLDGGQDSSYVAHWRHSKAHRSSGSPLLGGDGLEWDGANRATIFTRLVTIIAQHKELIGWHHEVNLQRDPLRVLLLLADGEKTCSARAPPFP